jgi:hypothetical protein
MVSLLFAGITCPLFKRTVMPKLLTQVLLLRPQSGRILIGMVAGLQVVSLQFWFVVSLPDEG